MGTARLNDCMLLAFERNLSYDIDLEKLAVKWSILKDRKEKLQI